MILEADFGSKAESAEGKDGRRKRVRCKDGVVRIVVRKFVETVVVLRRVEKGRWARMRVRSSGVLKTASAARELSAILRISERSLSESVV